MEKDYFLGLSEEGFHRIAYTTWGKPNKTTVPIICVHGLTRNGRDFDALGQFLQYRGCQVFCPDIVGRGDSDWLKNPLHYTYEQYLADMTAMIARINAQTVDWVGTSMGGLIGMVLAAMPNTPIRKLVLNDIGPQIPVRGIARLSQYAGRDPEFTNLDQAKAYYRQIYSDFGPLSDQEWQNFTEHTVKEVSPGRFVSKMDHGVKLASAKSKLAWKSLIHPLKALEGTLFDVDLWDVWRKVRCPVMVIRGIRSDMLLPPTIEKMKETHSNVEVVTVEDAGHAPALLDAKQHERIYQWLMQS